MTTEGVIRSDAPPKRSLATLTTRDLLLIAVTGIAFGVLFAGVFYLYAVVLAALPPAAFAFAGMAFCGPFFTAYVFRNPLAVLLGQVIGGLAAMPFHPAGLAVIVGVLLYGVLSLIALAIGTRFRQFGKGAWAIAAMLASALNLMWNGFVLRSFAFEPLVNAALAALAVVSCFAFVFLARAIADSLLRAGVLGGTALGRATAQMIEA
jgi:ABC-type thiamin/hydroxymethylpyrimidine transport system permease subunit